jgi:DNA-binding transcriptional MerR regulator
MQRKYQLPANYFEKNKAAAGAFPWIDITTAAHRLGVTVRTVRRWQAAGMMPPRIKQGRRWKYHREHIAAMIAAKSLDEHRDQGVAK